MINAIVREVSPAIGRCELTYQEWVEIDYDLACHQHTEYIRALEGLGCQVTVLPAEPDLPDSVFVEDTALVLDELGIITRPGTESRRPETVSVSKELARHRPLALIQDPATLEGGDILRVGRAIYVGLSRRSNPEGIAQLRALAEPLGYTVHAVQMQDCLHLKSAVSQIAPGALLLNPRWVQPEAFPGLQVIEVDPSDPHAANALQVRSGLIYPACFPLTLARLKEHGIAVTVVDVSEMQKAEGAVTCCSLLIY